MHGSVSDVGGSTIVCGNIFNWIDNYEPLEVPGNVIKPMSAGLRRHVVRKKMS